MEPPGSGSRRWALTPLALALLMVETTDLLFAVDSIPATFAVTTDPFLVFTSNIFAVLGLRAMYFALAGVLQKFKYLSVSLAAVLALVGLKMLAPGRGSTAPTTSATGRWAGGAVPAPAASSPPSCARSGTRRRPSVNPGERAGTII